MGDVGAEESDELACRPDDEVLPSVRVDDDLSLDFLDDPPPNNRLKKPGLLSPLLDMSTQHV